MFFQVNGNQVNGTFELTNPGGTTCVCVGSPKGRSSSVWAFQASPRDKDVYIANLSIADFQKMSLHASGKWRWAWSQLYASQNLNPDQDRAIVKWDRPEESVPGWTAAFQVWVLHEDLTEFAGLSRPKDPFFAEVCRTTDDIFWIPAPNPGEAVVIYPVIGRADTGTTTFEESLVCGVHLLRSSSGLATEPEEEVLLVLAKYVAMSEGNYGMIEHARERALSSLDPSSTVDRDTGRGYLFGEGSDEVKAMWDIGLRGYERQSRT